MGASIEQRDINSSYLNKKGLITELEKRSLDVTGRIEILRARLREALGQPFEESTEEDDAERLKLKREIP